MAPFLPVVSINGQQQVRLGRGPGNAVPRSLNLGDTAITPQAGNLTCAFYANLGQAEVRRDLQRHSAIGSIISVGNLTLSLWSDLFAASGLVVSAGSGFGLNISAGILQSRLFGGQAAVAAVNGLTPVAPSAFDRTDLVVISNNGVISVVQGPVATGAATYEVDSVVTSGTPTGGTFTLGFTYNGFNYTTGTIAYNASAATVASAILAATGGPALPSGTVTGSGGALPTAVTLTASGALEGPITNQRVVANALTGGANPSVAYTVTTPGVGATLPNFAGASLPLATVFIPSTATSSSNYTITNIAQTS
jgi:hypothetical protein